MSYETDIYFKFLNCIVLLSSIFQILGTFKHTYNRPNNLYWKKVQRQRKLEGK